MKFTLTTAGHFYTKEEADKLKVLGFEFSLDDAPYRPTYYKEDKRPIVEIQTIEELIKFCDDWGGVILENNDFPLGSDESPYILQVYDDYIE